MSKGGGILQHRGTGVPPVDVLSYDRWSYHLLTSTGGTPVPRRCNAFIMVYCNIQIGVRVE
jgi:hypothetical protein